MAIHELLAILTEVLTAHESRDGGNGLEVVPILVDDLAKAIDVIAGVVHGAGGVILNASDQPIESVPEADLIDLSGPLDGGRDDPALRGIVTSALQYRSGGTHREVQITSAGSQIDASYITVGAPGDDTVLRVARALFAPRVDDHHLGVIFYDETALDDPQNACCWSFNGQLARARVGRLRTLLYVVRAQDENPSIKRHVAPETGFEWAWCGGQRIKRDRWSMKEAVTEACEDAPFMVLFLGAGFSWSSGIALGNSLRDEAIRRLLDDDGTIEPEKLPAAFYTYLEEHGQLLDSERDPDLRGRLCAELTLERVLTEESRRRDHAGVLPTLEAFGRKCSTALANAGSCVRSLHRMFVSDRRLVICTVNFDELAEHDQGATVRIFATEDEFKDCKAYLDAYLAGTESAVPVLKLHGTITEPSSCVATDEATLIGVSAAKNASLLCLSEAAQAKATSGSGPSPWIYIGASMRDHDLRPVLTQPGFADRLQERWVLPYAQQSVQNFIDQYRAAQWRKASAISPDSRIVTETADTFMAALATKWTA